MKPISIVIPLYRCEKSIPELVGRLKKTLSKISNNFEIIMINDFSPLSYWNIVETEAKMDKRIKGINFSRNFGQHYAITAGLEFASGDYIVVMDGDLQDQPEEILNLYNKIEEGYDIVFAKRRNRQDHFFKKLGSKFFYKILSYLTNTEQNSEIANFGIYDRKVIDSIIQMNDSVKYFPTMVRWVGFKKSSIYVAHSERPEGNSSYNFKSLLNLAFNVILSFSNKPLRLTVKLGLIISSVSFLSVLFFLYKFFIGDIEVLGYTSLIISIWLLSGVIITFLGMVGLYIGKIFDQVKGRPNYIINNKLNF